ncbi:hypothetical protein [Companilactobacillus mishanensis]|uniref:Uncharacterized protein n=1 Tax=Companilactobacillus mishanensis TaxID=2486008 RepID=A0A5P0ZGJ7_9LACO|nr:hypothetical protein [Companilactobacillus mishanensis]MQS52138.1 hypothetical protein [Companilactobacillus mishanensis]
MRITEEDYQAALAIVGNYQDWFLDNKPIFDEDSDRELTDDEVLEQIADGLIVMRVYYTQQRGDNFASDFI